MFSFKVPFYILHAIFLLWIFCVYLCGIWVFSTGFLLSRIEIHNHSKCHLTDDLVKLGLGLTSICPATPPSFSRAVILLIDGLRYDFALYDDSAGSQAPPYKNKMPIFKHLLEKAPRERSLLVPFVADPPTTTLQRLKGLTTGSLPTFVDVGANFARDEITEDNIITQCIRHGKRIVFLGDDTWTGLFPRHFVRSFPYPSFNVKDLHTVDNGIMQQLPTELKQKDWDVLIAHFLGVDHCGHRYGPSHPEMAAKLIQMNNIIRDIVDSLDNETVMFVMGDHGMTKTGDHGGDSNAEVTSALFMHSPSHLLARPYDLKQKKVPQVDFVPTFSMLLGLPIPFSNLGSAIPELFKDCDKALLVNAQQVSLFLDTYATTSSQFSTSTLQDMGKMLKKVKDLHTRLEDEPILLQEVCTGYETYLKGVKDMCSEKWAQFDVISMAVGILILSLIVIFLSVILLTSTESDLRTLGKCVWTGVLFGIVPCALLFSLGYFSTASLISTIFLLSVLSPLLFTLKENTICGATERGTVMYESSVNKGVTRNLTLKEWIVGRLTLKDVCAWFPSVVTVLYFACFFSNSLVVNEDYVVLTLCQSLILMCTASACVTALATRGFRWRLGNDLLSTGALLLCVRGLSFFYKCREEQEPCDPSFYNYLMSSDLHQAWRLLFAAVCMALPVAVLVVWLSRQSNGYDLSELFVRYALPLAALCTVAQWAVSKAPERMLKKLLPGNQEIAAKTSAYLCLSIIAVIIARPMSSTSSSVLSRFTFSLTANLLSVLAAVAIVLQLLTGDGWAIAVVLMLLCASLWTYLVCRQDVTKGHDIRLGWCCAVVWAMLASVGFFATGHQNTFPTIHWNAAFVASDGNSTGKLLPVVAITLETFSSQIIFAVGLPLLPTAYIFLARQRLLAPQLVPDMTSYRTFLPVIGSSRASYFETALLRIQISFLLFSGVKLLGTVLACAVLRRHLMVWKIFAPRFVFEMLGCATTMIATMLAHLMTLRLLSRLSKHTVKGS